MGQAREVMQVVTRMDPGGVEVWLMRILRAIDRSRFHFTFCATSPKPGFFDQEIRSLGAGRVVCPVRSGPWWFARRFRSILSQLRPDVVHSHGLFFSGYVLRLAQRAGVPIRIAHSHDTHDGHRSSLARRAYRWLMRRYIWEHSTHALGCSSQAADWLFSPRWRGRPNFHILPCGIETRAFGQPVDRGALFDELGIPRDRKIIGHVGNFRTPKNHPLVVRLLEAARKKGANVHLVLVGSGEPRAQIETLVRELGQGERVTFTGARGDVPRLMEGLFDLFVLPSWWEGLPVVAVEAQCAGLPCLLSDAITREVEVVEGLVHWQSPHAAAEAWAERALQLLAQPRYDRQRALETVRNSVFSIQAGMRMLSELYAGGTGT
jgi:glycosyltransferase involved in cell wall biosynthesis